MFSALKQLTLTSKEKAFVGGLVAGVAGYLNQNGLTYHDLWSWHIVQALVIFLLVHQSIYWTTNSQG